MITVCSEDFNNCCCVRSAYIGMLHLADFPCTKYADSSNIRCEGEIRRAHEFKPSHTMKFNLCTCPHSCPPPRPQTCSISRHGHTYPAKASILKRQAATAIPGGVTSGNLERGMEPKQSAPSTSAETGPPSPKQSPLPPGKDLGKGVVLKEGAKTTAAAVAAEEDASPIEAATVGEAKATSTAVGQGTNSSVKPKEVSSVASAVGTDSSISAAGEAVEPVVAAEGKAASVERKKKKRDGARPETTAAEKVSLVCGSPLCLRPHVLEMFLGTKPCKVEVSDGEKTPQDQCLCDEFSPLISVCSN